MEAGLAMNMIWILRLAVVADLESQDKAMGGCKCVRHSCRVSVCGHVLQFFAFKGLNYASY